MRDKMKNQKTEHLIQQAKTRDPDAFTALMDMQVQGMYKIARAILHKDEDAADAIQETILICWEKLDSLKVDRYFKTWLTRILINNCYKLLQKNCNIIYMDEVPDIPTESNFTHYEWEEALSVLKENYRLIVTLFYSQGFHTKEIAQILGIPDNTVRTRLSRAREQLERYYKE